MIRLALFAAGLAATTPGLAASVLAASPAPSASYIIATAPSRPLTDSSTPVVGFTAAPMPNADLNAPLRIDPNARQASLKPSLFAPRNAYHGDGYVPGSTVQTEQEKRLKPTPGVNLSVPLQ